VILVETHRLLAYRAVRDYRRAPKGERQAAWAAAKTAVARALRLETQAKREQHDTV